MKTTEIARSFSYKLNLGNYSNADFFCSQKAEVPKGKEEEISEALYEFCKREVMKSVNAYKIETAREKMSTEKVEKPYIQKAKFQDAVDAEAKQGFDKEDGN